MSKESKSGAIVQTPIRATYTFETFEKSELNKSALDMISCFLEAGCCSPLFISGEVGVGKTHLANAIANKIKRERYSSKLAFFRSDDLLLNFIIHLKNDELSRFRVFFKDLDYLIVDDVQYFEAKRRHQEELTLIIEAIHDNGGQVILTANSLPYEDWSISKKLHSIFKSGLVVEIFKPDIQTAALILLRKAQDFGSTLSSEEALYIAKNLDLNGYELIGAINNIVMREAICGDGISMDVIESYFLDFKNDQSKVI